MVQNMEKVLVPLENEICVENNNDNSMLGFIILKNEYHMFNIIKICSWIGIIHDFECLR